METIKVARSLFSDRVSEDIPTGVNYLTVKTVGYLLIDINKDESVTFYCRVMCLRTYPPV